MAIQAEYHDEPQLVPQSTGLVSFAQLAGASFACASCFEKACCFYRSVYGELMPFVLLGGLIGISIGGTVFGNRLAVAVAKYAPDLPAGTASSVRQSVEVIKTLQGADKQAVIRAYSEALGAFFRSFPIDACAVHVSMCTGEEENIVDGASLLCHRRIRVRPRRPYCDHRVGVGAVREEL